jgi:nucleoside-diphosphate-sugar epimerase
VLETEFADLSYTIFRPPAVYGPGDRELRALLWWLCRGILFVPRGVPARLSLLHVSDLAAAVRAWLDSAASATAGCIFTLDDGRPGGYAWEDIRRVGAKLRRLPVVQIAVPRALLQLAAGINTLRTHISSGYRPMLTHGKIRELYHHDWVCDHHALQAACGWQPRIRLIDGLVMLAGSDIGERAPENV